MAKTETVTIKEREIEVAVDAWPLEKFHLDLANPRYAHLSPKERENEESMEAAIWALNESKELYQSIKVNRGLITPIYVNHDGITVEGNRRVTVLRHLKKQLDAGKETDQKLRKLLEHVPCRVFPEDFSSEQRALFLAYEHVTGKKPWPAMNEAAHLWQMNQDFGYSYEQIAHFLGKSKSFVQQKIWAFEKTREYQKFNPKDKDIQRFSYFEEFYKKRGELGYSEKDDPDGSKELLSFVFNGIKNELFNEDKARDMRHLAKILADSNAKEAFANGVSLRGKQYKGTEAALRVLEERYPSTPTFQAVKQTLDQLNKLPHAEYQEIPEFPRKVELLIELRDRLNKIIDDLELES